MRPPIPYAIRTLALSHARAWPTALWTGVATALAAGLLLSVVEWALLIGLSVVCAAAVQTITAQIVQTWLSEHNDVRDDLDASSPPLSEFDAVIRRALATLA